MAQMMDIQIDNELSSVIDQTAMILVSMKNDPTPPSSPVPTHHALRASAGSPLPVPSSLKNELCECMLCTRSAPIILSKCHTWAWIMRVVFYSLRDRYPEKKFFSLKNDVYEYMMNHWNILGLDRKRMSSPSPLFVTLPLPRPPTSPELTLSTPLFSLFPFHLASANWHKQIQDMLSHSRNIFESGMTHFKQNGMF